MTDESLDTDALGHWLGTALGVEFGVAVTGRPSGGFSAETVLLDATADDGSIHRFVLRLETPEPAIYPQQSDLDMPEIEIQFRIMDRLARHSSIPVAELIGYEPDTRVLGTEFFVMRHVEGVVPIESPPYSLDGFFTQLEPAERTALVENGLARLAEIHRVDLPSLELDWLVPRGATPGTAHLLNLWRNFGTVELDGRNHPLLERAWDLLPSALPDDAGISLCWGDPRPGNIIWQGTTAACLTDFEAACIGSPEFDLGWWLMFDRTMHELVGIDRLPGDPTRDEQRERYFDFAGRTPIDTTAHEVFAAARYCVIVVRVMNRLDQRGLLPPDSTVWRDNPASACLDMLLAELE